MSGLRHHRSLRGSILALGSVLVLLGPAAEAKEYNKRQTLGPGQNAKIQRVITHGRTEEARQREATDGIADGVQNPNASIVNTGCGELSFGNVRTTGRPGERAPRENIVVAREVINAPINCGTRGRRR